MADPLSISAGILAVLGAAGKTAQGLEQVYSLKDASKDLLCVINEVSTMRATLQMVKIVTDSLQGRDIESMQPILQEVNSLHVQASNLLEELDSLVKEKLQKPGKGSPESPKAAKMPWLRQQRNLDRLQRQIKSITQSLSTSLTVLNTFQLAALSQSETARISLSIQGVSVIGGNHSTTQIAGNVSSVQAQLEHVLQQITSSEVSSAQLRPEDRISEIEQEPRNSNEAGESEDANLALISREGIPNPSTESVVRIVTNVSTENCNRFCQCQCHVRSQYRTPNWARGVFGSFYFQTNASMWLKRRGCNYPLCKKSGRPSTQIAFYAPSWMLRAAFYINAVKDDLDGMGANIAFKTPRVVPQLHIAWSLVSAGQVDRLVELFTVGKASIYDVGEDGESLLHYAARMVQPQVCQKLMELGADPLFCSFIGIPVFELALDHVLANTPSSSNLSTAVVTHFHTLFANEDTYDALEFTPLHRIVLGLSTANLKTQLELSISDINTGDSGGRTPLMWAARRGDIQAIRTLIEYGADVNKRDKSLLTPLHKAVADADDTTVELLLEAGADPHVTDDGEAQPIHNIFFSPQVRIRTINALVARGADPNARTGINSTPLHWAAAAAGDGVLENVRHLVRCGADIDAVDDWGDSAVMNALLLVDTRVMSCLIELGARLDLKRKGGDINILHLAAWTGTIECWKILEEAAQTGKMRDVDTDATHEGHHLLGCLKECRSQKFARDREDESVEKNSFKRLLEAVNDSKVV